MTMPSDILDLVRQRAADKILYLPHAIRQMSKPDRMITTQEIRRVIEYGQLIEDYPDDARGHSCLILGFASVARPIHVVCSPKDDYLAIITAYLPSDEEWENDFKTRKKS